MSLLYTVVIAVTLAVAFAVGAVAGYVKHQFFEPATLHCPVASTDERCVRARKIAERMAAMKAEERGDQPSSKIR